MDSATLWKDPVARDATQLKHPSGDVDLSELDDLELSDVNGAATGLVGTWGCCWCVPWYSSWTQCGLICSHPGCKW